MATQRIWRQGDVLIIATDKADTSGMQEAPLEDGRIVLAHSEVTGHAHAIVSPGAKLFSRVEDLGRQASRVAGLIGDRILQLRDAAVLRHEEHDPIKLPAGTYKIVIQREYHPEELRNVAD